MTATAETRPAPGVWRHRRRLRGALLIVMVVVAAATLRGRLPDQESLLTALRTADLRWLAVALAAGLLSQLCFAEQQRRLLAAFSVRLPAASAVALTFSRSAISMAVPAGSAVSAAYAFRVFRRAGATPAVAVAVTVLSAVVSTVGLALLYGLGWSVPGTLAVLVAVVALGDRSRRLLPHKAARVLRDARTVPLRKWAAILLAAVGNWLLDMLCLVAASMAVQADVSVPRLALIYLAVQLVRQIPLTPGGLGLIETSMLAGLTAAGSTEANAAAVILIYRLISFWLILPLGLTAHLKLRSDRKIRSRGERILR